MVFLKIVFRNIITFTCARVSKDAFLGKKEISSVSNLKLCKKKDNL